VNLPRPTDVELLAAWLESDVVDWEAEVARHPAAELDARAALLGLAVAIPGSVTEGPLLRRPRGQWTPGLGRAAAGLRVVDLTALWAGPLCASILGLSGAEVIKVEDRRRPDGGRFGPPAFYDLLHAGHRSVTLDVRSPVLLDLLRSADVVLESSRPRALEQLGIDREAIAAETGCVWVSISGRGLDGEERNRPAFGDDAAVAGGLVAIDPDDGGPLFCADALADPVTGLTAAALALQALLDGGPWIVDAGLAPCAAALAGPPAETLPDAARPRARPPRGVAAPMGADTEEVLAHVG
jgi:crotonobetainyl-CoA:carnitine CoA-transferase CaiB-like acyl-CoA transferase